MTWRGTSSRVAAAVLLALAATTAGCGRKADPQPPVIRIADRTRDLSVYQEGTDAVLTWSYPSTTTAGGPLPDVEAVEIWRAAMPSAREPRGTTPRDQQLQIQLLATTGERLAVLEGPLLDAATRGAQLLYEDDLQAWWETMGEQEPMVLWYAVRTRCCRGRQSAPSNVARLTPSSPPPPPEGLEAEATAAGVTLRWVAVEGVGTLVERSSRGVRWQRLNSEPATGAEYLDRSAGQGQQWSYRVRAVRLLPDGGRVIGLPTAAVTISFADVYPPAAPAELVCLPEGERVRLRWETVGEAVEYRVFRQKDGGRWDHLQFEVTARTFVDLQPPAGALVYAVKAVDRAGNESEAATCTTTMGANR